MVARLRSLGFAAIRRQCGAAAVEFAMVATVLFLVLFGIMEFGRFMYVGESIQEVTRRAARIAVVTVPTGDLTELASTVKTPAILGGTTYPAANELTAANISIQYLNPSGSVIPSSKIPSPTDNIAQCQMGSNTCIANVQVSLGTANSQVRYQPATQIISNLPLPLSTVTMPAESMGFTP